MKRKPEKAYQRFSKRLEIHIMTNQNVLPGILDNGIEFFVSNDQVKAITNGKVLDFTELPFATIQILEEAIEADKEVKMHLLDMHPNSKFKRLEQFTKCRFGGLDYQADLSHEGVQAGEYWDCPLRGKCASEGVLCKAASINGSKLTSQDVQFAKLLATDATNEVIAGEMNLPMGSFHLAKKKYYQKLGISTKQESTILAQRHNLISGRP